ncbi:hypothetical protein [Sphingomonas sp. KR3-1]|uniref:hypothetical protein n=1 Tax=Sphingomonas sp. KR3-1 TaxID=3156611 RepID=UPI0032B62466
MLKRLALAAIALSVPAGASAPRAQTAPAAAAEPDILNNANPDSFQVYGLPGGAKPTPIKDPKVQFGKAIRIETPGGGNVWSVGVNSPLQAGAKKGDKILIAFYARVEKPADGTTSATIAAAQLQLAAAPYTKVFGEGVTVGPEWKLYKVAGHADRDYAKGELAAALHVNTARQTLDIGALAVLDFGQKP